MKNRYNLDVSYFKSKLALTLADLDSHTPQELARTLARLAKTACEESARGEFPAPFNALKLAEAGLDAAEVLASNNWRGDLVETLRDEAARAYGLPCTTGTEPAPARMQLEYTCFGETRLVCAEPYNMRADEVPDVFLWVERSEDLYALMSRELKDKKVAVVRRADWLLGQAIAPSTPSDNQGLPAASIPVDLPAAPPRKRNP